MEEHKLSKKYIILTIILVIAFALFMYFMLKHKDNRGPTQEEKIDIVNSLNFDAKKESPLPLETKEAIIKNMTEEETLPLTTEKKKNLIDKYNNGFIAPTTTPPQTNQVTTP